jgi:hypothetical protein
MLTTVQVYLGNSKSIPNGRRGPNERRVSLSGAVNISKRTLPSKRLSQGRTFRGSPTTWYKVTIPYGGMYHKDYICEMLRASVAPAVFIPLNYEVNGKHSSFYLDDYEVAEMLANIDRKITTVKGFKLLVIVKPGLPYIELSSAQKDKIKAAMVKHYNENAKALDLSWFHVDPDLVDTCALTLFRPSIMMAVLDIIVENVPGYGPRHKSNIHLKQSDKI